MRRTAMGGVVVLSLMLAACSSNPSGSGPSPGSSPSVSPSAVPVAVSPPPSLSPSPSVSPVPAHPLPIAVSAALSSSGQDPAILVPGSCSLAGATLTASGTLGGNVAESYVRYGDAVELYAYSQRGPASAPRGAQVLDLSAEKPFMLGGSEPWTVVAPVAATFPAPAQCFVAIQSTHAFMAAGDAGG